MSSIAGRLVSVSTTQYTKLKEFEEFKRQCKTTETHRLETQFYDRYGDIERPDSFNSHRTQRYPECCDITAGKAAEKRRVTEEINEEFTRRLDGAWLEDW